jgi:hypothetical protein
VKIKYLVLALLATLVVPSVYADIKYEDLVEGATYKFVGSAGMALVCYNPATARLEARNVEAGSNSKSFPVKTAVVALKDVEDFLLPPVEDREIRFVQFSSDPQFDLCYLKVIGKRWFWNAHSNFLEKVTESDASNSNDK